MKKVLVLWLISCVIIIAEEKENNLTPKFGLGITCNSIFEKTIYEDRYNENPFSFLISYNLGTNFRLEATFFYNNYKKYNEMHNINSKKTDYSIGVFRRNEKKRFINYYGCRLGQIYDDKDGKLQGNYFIPTVGSEFKVINHFNIGCEFGINFLRYTLIEESESYDNTYNQLISKFIIRYYL